MSFLFQRGKMKQLWHWDWWVDGPEDCQIFTEYCCEQTQPTTRTSGTSK